MTGKFWLIQTGKFANLNRKYSELFDGNDSLIRLDYMGYAEFEFGAVGAALNRIMHDKEQYKFHTITDIVNYRDQPLIIFCKESMIEEIKEVIQYYIKTKYGTKSFTDFHNWFRENTNHTTDFWWCIERKWNFIFFFGDKRLESFSHYLEEEYNNWYLSLSESDRKELYKKACMGFYM